MRFFLAMLNTLEGFDKNGAIIRKLFSGWARRFWYIDAQDALSGWQSLLGRDGSAYLGEPSSTCWIAPPVAGAQA
jgi:hypothetical protein